MAKIFTPSVPFTCHLSRPFLPGSKLTIDGFVQPNGNGFAINLKNAAKGILVHFNPRFNENTVVFNSNNHGPWAHEERCHLPLHRGVPFSVTFVSTPSHTEVIVNGQPLHNFNSRGNPADIVEVEINGDIHVTFIDEQPSIHSVPFTLPLLGRSGPPLAARHIYVSGKVTGPSFAVNLRRGGDIAFHYNPRINENTVVRNACIGGGWGREERGGEFPFAVGQDFNLHFIVGPTATHVILNDRHHFDFPSRGIPPEAIDSVEVTGNVAVLSCHN